MDIDHLNDETLRHHDLLAELGPDDDGAWVDEPDDYLDTVDYFTAEGCPPAFAHDPLWPPLTAEQRVAWNAWSPYLRLQRKRKEAAA